MDSKSTEPELFARQDCAQRKQRRTQSKSLRGYTDCIRDTEGCFEYRIITSTALDMGFSLKP